MKALTIKQPWCAAIAYGAKRVENRSWPVPRAMVGETIALHAGKSLDASARGPAGEGMPVEDWPLEFGAVIAVATLADCHSWHDCSHICPEPEDWDGVYLPCTETGAACNNTCSPWGQPDQYHWQLENVRPLAAPVPCKGALGLWNLPEDIESAVRAQLAASRGQ